MTSPNSSCIKENKNIKWYRSDIDLLDLKTLITRNDLHGLFQAGGHLLVCIITAYWSYYFWTLELWLFFIIAIYMHGTVCAFAINAVHELSHQTVFKNKFLNNFFLYGFSFIGWINPYLFWKSHTEHHKYTLHSPHDREIELPIKYTLFDFVLAIIGNPRNLFNILKETLLNTCGVTSNEWHKYLFANSNSNRPIFTWARTLILIHLSIFIFSIWHKIWVLPILTSLTPCYGQLLFWLCNNTQHTGLSKYTSDFRLNSRTFYINPIFRFLYWNMNYHIEHHMYAAVPCYNLPKLHNIIKNDLPPIQSGLFRTWREIVHILKKQKSDPSYQYIPTLPRYKEKLSPSNQLNQLDITIK